MSPIDLLAYFITERESVRKKKLAKKPKPWTNDAILQNYRFTNIRRMDDKVSRWLLHNWYKPHTFHPNILRVCALARFVNNPASLATITKVVFSKQWQPKRLVKMLRQYRDKGNTVFNGAYIVRGNDGMDKIDCVVNYYVEPLKNLKLEPQSIEESHKILMTSFGMGSFMAGQVIADLRFAMPSRNRWLDRNTWAAIGPGSRRGINRVLGRDIKAPLKQEQFTTELQKLMQDLKAVPDYFCLGRLPAKLPEEIVFKLEAIDYQNCLCEFDKYCRALYGEGRPKQKYTGV